MLKNDIAEEIRLSKCYFCGLGIYHLRQNIVVAILISFEFKAYLITFEFPLPTISCKFP